MLSLEQAVKLTFAGLDRRFGDNIPGIDVGLQVFGRGGLQAVDLHVIAGGPGAGKTELAVRVARPPHELGPGLIRDGRRERGRDR